MRTWGYIKSVALSKLDLEFNETEAVQMGYLNRFTIYANEAMTQICSAVLPKRTFYEVIIDDENLGQEISMPDDFVSFGDDINEIEQECYNARFYDEATDEDFVYVGYNKIRCFRKGKYRISYNARWVDDFEDMENNDPIEAPIDVIDAIPSYIVSQCYKIDDEYKASVFRNEFEMMLARIDDTDYKRTKTLKIGGDW